MKKFFLCVLFLSLNLPVFSGDYYLVGVDAFKKGAYNKAASNLEHAVRINPKNVNARYYLAQVYLSQNRKNDALEQYQRIILIAPLSDAARLSGKGVSYIMTPVNSTKIASNTSLTNSIGDNYLDYVLNGAGEIARWKTFPIKVYIQPSNQTNPVKEAFKTWQKSSNNLVSFIYSQDKNNAQITVNFVDKLETSSTKEGFLSGASKPYYQDGWMSKSEIKLMTKDPNTSQSLTSNMFLSVALHEIGHSLGFAGHSPNENDIMYPVAYKEKTVLTQRDLNTLKMVYSVNRTYARSINHGIDDKKLQEALNYTKFMPEKYVGWANLGDIYAQKGQYKDSVKNYKKAIAIEPQKADLYNLLANVYAKSGDTQNAFQNYKKACDLDKENIFMLYQFVQMASQTPYKNVAKGYLDSYIKKNPQSISDEKIQSLLLLYK